MSSCVLGGRSQCWVDGVKVFSVVDLRFFVPVTSLPVCEMIEVCHK